MNVREKCYALAEAIFEKIKNNTDDDKGHLALNIMDDMLKTMPEMRIIIGGDLARAYDLYANIEHHPMIERFHRQNSIRIMYRLIHLYVLAKPHYEEALQDLIFNLGVEEE